MADVTSTQIALQGATRHAAPTGVVPDATPSLPPAGWYVDPFDALQRRWWSGTEWTGHVRLVIPAAEPGYVMVPSVMPTASAFTAGDMRSSIRDLAADLAARDADRPLRAVDLPAHRRRHWRPSAILVAVLGLVVVALGAAIVWGLAHPEILVSLGIAPS